MSVYEGFIKYYNTFGIYAVLTVSSHRLFGRPREITVRPFGVRKPARIRIRSTDSLVYNEILLGGQYAFDLPFSPKTIIDGGANIGISSIYFANRYPEAKIFAVEAEASNFAVLRRNIRPYPAIVPIHAALWNRDGEVVVGAPDPATGAHGEWGFVTHEGSVGTKVRAVTMDTLMHEMRISSADLVKLDIEGAEQEVFENTRWLKNVRCLMIELHDELRSGCTSAVEPAMATYTRLQRGETTFYVRTDMSGWSRGNRVASAMLTRMELEIAGPDGVFRFGLSFFDGSHPVGNYDPIVERTFAWECLNHKGARLPTPPLHSPRAEKT